LRALRERYPAIQVLKRRNSPFAASAPTTPRQPLRPSQKDMENRTSVYVERAPSRRARSAIWRFAPCTPTRWRSSTSTCSLRAAGQESRRPELLPERRPNHLAPLPWGILDYEGGGHREARAGSFGFRVESLQAVKERLQTVGDNNPHLRPSPGRGNRKGKRGSRSSRACPYGAHHLADPDGVLLDIAEK